MAVSPTINYSRDTARGYAGMIASTVPHTIISNVVKSDSANIPFGRSVLLTAEKIVALPSGSAGKWAGIAVAERVVPFAQGEVFVPYDQIPCMKEGEIWVDTSVAVAAGDPVYYVNASGLHSNVSNSSANTLIENAEFITATAGAGLAKIRLGKSK